MTAKIFIGCLTKFFELSMAVTAAALFIVWLYQKIKYR